ncbi:MAG: DUF3791 domain-containing protein [Bacteroidales bacterium]|nr:DUF3791 domain-containing protein [Bacteroidales bacterium]
MAVKKINSTNDKVRFVTLCVITYSEQKKKSVQSTAALFNRYGVTDFLFKFAETEGGLTMSNIIEDIDIFIRNRKNA